MVAHMPTLRKTTLTIPTLIRSNVRMGVHVSNEMASLRKPFVAQVALVRSLTYGTQQDAIAPLNQTAVEFV